MAGPALYTKHRAPGSAGSPDTFAVSRKGSGKTLERLKRNSAKLSPANWTALYGKVNWCVLLAMWILKTRTLPSVVRRFITFIAASAVQSGRLAGPSVMLITIGGKLSGLSSHQC